MTLGAPILRPLRLEEAAAVAEVVSREPPERLEETLLWLLGEDFDRELWFLAHGGDSLAGIALCRRHRTRLDTGRVQVLGVRRPRRRRGIGRALLLHAFAELRRRGLGNAGLGVDAASLTGAHRLYERAGMTVAHRFAIYEKALA